MNPFHLRLLWKGLTGRSIVFSLLFAMAVLGYSGAGFLREAFRSIPFVPWWAVWVAPMILIGMLAKREDRWLPNITFRRVLSLAVVSFSVLFGLLLARMESEARALDPLAEQELSRPRQTGPRGK